MFIRWSAGIGMHRCMARAASSQGGLARPYKRVEIGPVRGSSRARLMRFKILASLISQQPEVLQTSKTPRWIPLIKLKPSMPVSFIWDQYSHLQRARQLLTKIRVKMDPIWPDFTRNFGQFTVNLVGFLIFLHRFYLV